VAQTGERERVSFASNDGVQNSESAPAGDVTEYVMHLQIHLTQGLLHVHRMLGRHLNEALPMAPQGTDHADLVGWPEARFQQTNRMQILNPLAI
jgi:hypothetical protein